MHTCLELTNISGHGYVERELCGLTARLSAFCDSIHSCEIALEGPSGEGAARYWHVELKLRVFDEIVRAAALASEGSEPEESLARALSDIYARATAELVHIAEQRHACCAQDIDGSEARTKACA
jgi:hypothetical protein